MTNEEIINIIESQREFFKTNTTLNVKTRIQYLKKLYKSIKNNEQEINLSLYKDLGKSATESYMCEIGLVLSEITYMLKHIKKFSKKQKVKTPLAHYFASSFQIASPRGCVLIMSPWNYPILLTLDPLVDAISAGNVAIIKTSEYSPNTNQVLKKIIEEVFPSNYVCVIEGGKEENSILIKEKFDHIFFTGSKKVGNIVYQEAAKNMTPVTLELGGKSPCIIDKDCDLKMAVHRLVWGKFLNLGQTCVAPDYVFVHEDIHFKFITLLKEEIKKQFTSEPLKNQSYGKIINEHHFNRLVNLIDKNKVIHGGKFVNEELKIEPTVLDNVTFDDEIMKEEIFGPILPLITYSDINKVKEYINMHDSPLAFYIFSNNNKLINDLTTSLRFGGGCINDVVIHLATPNMSFGGFNESGLGSYHGKKGFETFSHYKSIVRKRNFIELPMRYQPYSKLNDKLIKTFLK